ncbi:MAG: hypothetical protein JRG97_15720 [Deltaproteobacteria bacterium]|nr:hypothetical protein [Deltaproteobacteria bacterium]MBW2142481.1 hypothetical protein [Deltaproteobacteria bacterium]MBW2324370.1 hypothetical protein [Deltaproteobacteria bacterium]
MIFPEDAKNQAAYWIKIIFHRVIARIKFRLITKVNQGSNIGCHYITNGNYMMFWRLSQSGLGEWPEPYLLPPQRQTELIYDKRSKYAELPRVIKNEQLF